MHTMLQKILKEKEFTSPIENIGNLLFTKIQRKIQLQTRILLLSYTVVGFVSAAFLFMYIKYLFIDLNNSNLYGYIHFIFQEDLQTLSTFSKEIIYALFESLPITSITLTLGLLFMIMLSINGIIVSLQKNRFLTTIYN